MESNRETAQAEPEAEVFQDIAHDGVTSSRTQLIELTQPGPDEKQTSAAGTEVLQERDGLSFRDDDPNAFLPFVRPVDCAHEAEHSGLLL